MYIVTLTSRHGDILYMENMKEKANAKETTMTIIADMTNESIMSIEDNDGKGTIVLAESLEELYRLEYAYDSIRGGYIKVGLKEFTISILEDMSASWEDVGRWAVKERLKEILSKKEEVDAQ